MKRVVEYVASGFRKDQIWLRRQRAEKRSYDILLAVDDSESMSDSGAGPTALEALVLITSALAKVDVGRLAVVTFGSETRLVRPLDDSLVISPESGDRLLSQFTFRQKATDVKRLLTFMQEYMTVSATERRISFIISDGRLGEKSEGLQRQIRQLREEGMVIAFLIINQPLPGKKNIFDVKKVDYTGNLGGVKITPYMAHFPFDFYAEVNDINSLPYVLGDALRQWMEATSPTI